MYAISILLCTVNKPKREYAYIRDGIRTFFENYARLRLQVLPSLRIRRRSFLLFTYYYLGT